MYKLVKGTAANTSFSASPAVIDEDINNIRTVKYNPYCKGLIFCVDGLIDNNNDNGWSSVMNYNHFFTNNGCTRISNGWQITNTTSTYNSLRFADTLPFGSGSFSTCTIECVYSSYQSRGEIIFQPKLQIQ